MKYKYTVLIILTLSITHYNEGNIARIKELEEAAYLKALEVQQIADQIRKFDDFWRHFGLSYKNELHQTVKKKLKEAKIDAEVKEEHLMYYRTKFDVQINKEYPVYFTIAERSELRNFFQADRHEKHIKKAINDIEDSMVAAGNDLSFALSGKGPFEHELTKELFELNNFNLLKFFVIQSAAELYLLKHLVTLYQSCLQELVEINNELLNLKQKENYE